MFGKLTSGENIFNYHVLSSIRYSIRVITSQNQKPLEKIKKKKNSIKTLPYKLGKTYTLCQYVLCD